MQQILAPKSPGLPFSDWNLTPLSTSSTLICSTESALLSEKQKRLNVFSVSLNWNCICLRTIFISVGEQLLVHFITLKSMALTAASLKLWSVYPFYLRSLDLLRTWKFNFRCHQILTLRRPEKLRKIMTTFQVS